MQFHFWYIVIHVGLGLAAYNVFTFTNEGGLYAAAAAAVVQAYGVWEIHRLAYPKFQASLAEAPSVGARQQMVKDYRIRLLRHWVFRTSAYGLLTLLTAMFVRGAMHAVGGMLS